MCKKLLYLTCLLHTSALISQESWNVDANGDWGVAANWLPAVVPNGSAVTATLGDVITAARVVSLTTVAPTVGTLAFNTTMAARTYDVQQGGANVLTIASAITVAGVAAHTISSPVTMNAPVGVTQGSTADFTMSGVISGSGGIVKSGTGTLVLNAASNTYSGGTTINAGMIKCGVASTMPSAGTVAMSGTSTFDINAFSQTISALSSSSMMASVNIAGAQLTSNTSATTTFSGVISGAGGSFLLQGTGSLTLDNNNTYAGGTVISGGTLVIGINDALLPTGDVTVTSPGALNLNNFNQTIATLNTSTGSISLGSGNFTVTQAMAATFSGAMTGSGSFTKDGAATLTFSGANQYSGGTTITMGTLQCGAVDTLPVGGPVSITGTLNLNGFSQTIGALSGAGGITLGAGTLTVSSNASSMFGGAISGTGGLVKAGGGTLTLTAQSTFSGGVTINGGTLQCGVMDVFNVPMLDETVVVNAPGVFDTAGFNQTIGVMAGNGSINIVGTLTTDTATNSTFSGPIGGAGTLVKDGTSTLILLGPNDYGGGTTVSTGTLQGNTISLQGAITNNASLVFDQAFSGTFSGTLMGAGTLYKQGSGNVILIGANAQNVTNVTGGKLTVNGTLTSPVIVSAGAALGGIGTIVGDVVVNGTMQPGASIGTTTVMGGYTQTPGSILEVELDPTTSDLVMVIGPAMVSGLVQVLPQPGLYTPTHTYTIVSASMGVFGTYSGAVVNNPFFKATLLHTMGPPGTVQLVLAIAPFDDVIKGGNAGEVAKCINAASFPTDPDFLSIIEHLLFSPIPVVRDALDQMQPSMLKGLVLAEENNFILARTAISQRLSELYMVACNPDPHHWTMWTNVSGDFMTQEHDDQNVGFSATSGSATLGLDRVMSDYFTLGVAGAYNYSSLTWEESRGDGSVSSAYVGPYMNLFGHRAFLNFSALAAWSVYKASRHIDFPSVNRKADSDHHGFGALGHLDAGLILYPGGDVTIRPFAGCDYVLLHENSFTETGAKSLDLFVESSNSHLWRGEAGVNFSKCVIRGSAKWVCDVKGSYVREQRPGGEHYTARFKSHDCSFTVVGMHPDRNLFDFAIGVTGYFLQDRLTPSVHYEGEFGPGVADQTGFLQLVYRF